MGKTSHFGRIRKRGGVRVAATANAAKVEVSKTENERKRKLEAAKDQKGA